jgi:hypothetical protein
MVKNLVGDSLIIMDYPMAVHGTKPHGAPHNANGGNGGQRDTFTVTPRRAVLAQSDTLHSGRSPWLRQISVTDPEPPFKNTCLVRLKGTLIIAV